MADTSQKKKKGRGRQGEQAKKKMWQNIERHLLARVLGIERAGLSEKYDIMRSVWKTICRKSGHEALSSRRAASGDGASAKNGGIANFWRQPASKSISGVRAKKKQLCNWHGSGGSAPGCAIANRAGGKGQHGRRKATEKK
jgi:hypothetical protein